MSCHLPPYRQDHNLDCRQTEPLYYDDVKQNDALFGEKQIFDFSLVVGIKLKYKNLFAELQYQHGLTSAYRHVDIFKTKAISVNLGYMFNLKK